MFQITQPLPDPRTVVTTVIVVAPLFLGGGVVGVLLFAVCAGHGHVVDRGCGVTSHPGSLLYSSRGSSGGRIRV